jgi:hypothetical protein
VQRGQQSPVELDRADMRAGGREGERQGSQTRTHLDDAVAWPGAALGRDRVREVGVDQEVLSKGLRRLDAVTVGQLPDDTGAEPTRTARARVVTS